SMRFKKEAFDGKREEAVYFSKRVNECASPDSIFHRESKTNQLDYEVELVVIIGKDCKNIPKEQAKEVIFGYTIGNDISARDLQAKHKQWYAGKSLEGAFPMGPYIILRDSLDTSNLAIKSYVNGELRQNSNTSKMIFGIDSVIAELSSYFTLKAGSIISMGTPSGVGMGFNPPRFLQSGDIVTCEIEGIGSIRTRIV
ncbi:fumarylacetoacetase, partial [Helicobacter didelphidarum]